jgi:hypothetical protein
VTERSVKAAQDTRGGTSDLLRHAEGLTGILQDGRLGFRRGSNGVRGANGRTGSNGAE